MRATYSAAGIASSSRSISRPADSPRCRRVDVELTGRVIKPVDQLVRGRTGAPGASSTSSNACGRRVLVIPGRWWSQYARGVDGGEVAAEGVREAAVRSFELGHWDRRGQGEVRVRVSAGCLRARSWWVRAGRLGVGRARLACRSRRRRGASGRSRRVRRLGGCGGRRRRRRRCETARRRMSREAPGALCAAMNRRPMSRWRSAKRISSSRAPGAGPARIRR